MTSKVLTGLVRSRATFGHVAFAVAAAPGYAWRAGYAHYTPSQGSANRSASEGVLGAMARPAPVSPLFITVLPPLNSPSHPYSPQHIENHGNSAKFNFTPCLISKSGEVVHIALFYKARERGVIIIRTSPWPPQAVRPRPALSGQPSASTGHIAQKKSLTGHMGLVMNIAFP